MGSTSGGGGRTYIPKKLKIESQKFSPPGMHSLPKIRTEERILFEPDAENLPNPWED